MPFTATPSTLAQVRLRRSHLHAYAIMTHLSVPYSDTCIQSVTVSHLYTCVSGCGCTHNSVRVGLSCSTQSPHAEVTQLASNPHHAD